MQYAIISDIHEDFGSLKQVLEKAGRIGYDRLVCLGDIAGFSQAHHNKVKQRSAHRALEILEEHHASIVPGNHDYHIARRIPGTSGEFDFPVDWYTMTVEERQEISGGTIWLHEEDETDPELTEADRERVRVLPEYIVEDTGDYSVLFSHYAFPNLAGFLKGFYDTPGTFAGHFAFMDRHNAAVSFTGHAHFRGFYTVTNTAFRQFGYRRIRLRRFPVCVGIPPVTNNSNRRGFCIFDSARLSVRIIRV